MSKKNHVNLSHNEAFKTSFIWGKDLDENSVVITAYDAKKDITKTVNKSKDRD